MAASKTLTKQQRIERARKGAAAVNSLDGLIRRVVRRAPELRPEHVEQLRALLPPADDGGSKAA